MGIREHKLSGDQLQVRHAIDERTRKGHALAQSANYVERVQRLHCCVLREVMIEDPYFRFVLHRQPVEEGEGKVRVVVGYRDLGPAACRFAQRDGSIGISLPD